MSFHSSSRIISFYTVEYVDISSLSKDPEETLESAIALKICENFFFSFTYVWVDMKDEELNEGLSRFGLTPYEIKVYKSLLLNGPQASTGIVKNSSIPQPRVYDVCNTLIRKGFIEVSPGKTKIYRAVQISLSLKKNVESLNTFVDDLQSHVDSLGNHEKSEIPYMWLIEDDSNILKKFRNMVIRARDELIISLSSEHLNMLSKELDAAVFRGVTVALVVFSDTTGQQIASLPNSVVLKQRVAKAAEIAISDRSAAIVNMSIINKATPYGVFFEEDEMIHILSYYFMNTIWKPSKVVREFSGLHTRAFRTAWLACEAISAYLKSGLSLFANVEGISDGKRIEVNGKVEDYEIIEGQIYSFMVNDGKRVYSVGGKTANLEDISMLRLYLHKPDI